VVPITSRGLVLGRAASATETLLLLPEGFAGISRRHCSLRRVGTETVLIDHSQFGSFIDGQRVRGRAIVHAGSRLRIGTPGIELPLVALASS
jgi:pSer/pThr/pTyr-binding forkhead associated (FHA) protein